MLKPDPQPQPGRPPLSTESATAHIHLRVTMKRKNAYVKKARPLSLAQWCFKILDKASGFKEEEK